MPIENPHDIELKPITGAPQSLADWANQFHLALVVIDPFTHESAWALEVAGKTLRHFREADCRAAWVVTGSEGNARQFLGPWANEILTFVDPDRAVVEALQLESLPAFVHVNVSPDVVASAQGWNPGEWQEVADGLAQVLHWSTPRLARFRGPAPFAGSPAGG